MTSLKSDISKMTPPTRRFFSRTTAHGFVKLTSANSRPRRLVWTCICLIAYVFLFVIVAILTQNYLNPDNTITTLAVRPVAQEFDPEELEKTVYGKGRKKRKRWGGRSGRWSEWKESDESEEEGDAGTRSVDQEFFPRPLFCQKTAAFETFQEIRIYGGDVGSGGQNENSKQEGVAENGGEEGDDEKDEDGEEQEEGEGRNEEDSDGVWMENISGDQSGEVEEAEEEDRSTQRVLESLRTNAGNKKRDKMKTRGRNKGKKSKTLPNKKKWQKEGKFSKQVQKKAHYQGDEGKSVNVSANLVDNSVYPILLRRNRVEGRGVDAYFKACLRVKDARPTWRIEWGKSTLPVYVFFQIGKTMEMVN